MYLCVNTCICVHVYVYLCTQNVTIVHPPKAICSHVLPRWLHSLFCCLPQLQHSQCIASFKHCLLFELLVTLKHSIALTQKTCIFTVAHGTQPHLHPSFHPAFIFSLVLAAFFRPLTASLCGCWWASYIWLCWFLLPRTHLTPIVYNTSAFISFLHWHPF